MLRQTVVNMVNADFTLALLSVVQNILFVIGSEPQKRVEYGIDKIGTVGIRKSGTVINVLEDISLTTCSEYCIDKTDCTAFNYDLVFRTCETLDTVSGSEVKSENNLFVTDLTWTRGLNIGSLRSCAAKPCSGIQRCIDLENSGHVCVINECNYPAAREGMDLYNTTTKIGATAQYECKNYLNESYRYSPLMTCLPNGSWTDLTFHCSCGNPPSISRAKIEGTERRTSGSIKYTCNTAYYRPSGNPTSTCLTSGKWSSTDFRCLDGWTCSYASPCSGSNLKYTWGNNWSTPGCGSCYCCRKL